VRAKIIILAAATLAFGGTIAGKFLFDDAALFADPAITSPSGWLDCFRPLQTRPLTWFTFWINDRFSNNPIPWHAVNLLLHLACALLLWDLLRKLIPERAALFATLIFAVHPFLTEPIAYVYARATLLGAFFTLLTLRFWIADRIALAVFSFAAAMLAKEEYAAVPIVLLLLDLSRSKPIRWRPIAAMLSIALLAGARTIWATYQIPGTHTGPDAGITPARYLLSQGAILSGYLWHIIYPWGFSIDHQAAPAPIPQTVVAWTILAALMAIAAFRFRNLDAGFFFIAAMILLLPSSSIFPAADLASDHRMYLPLAFLAAAIAVRFAHLNRRAIAVIILVLIAVSIRYTSIWISPERVWREAVRLAPDKLRPQLQLARSVPPDQALPILDHARSEFPDDAAIPAEQGRVLMTLNRPGDALVAFGRALALNPSDAVALNNRGAALLALGQIEPARADFHRALARDPCEFDAFYNLQRSGDPVPIPAACRFTPAQQKLLDHP
jgi:protein O-mannosyl-transferase